MAFTGGSAIELEERLRRIEEALLEIRQQLDALISGEADLMQALVSRGMELHRKDPQEEILLPSDASPDQRDLFYQHLKRYSFRLFLRDVIAKGRGFALDDLLRYCSREVAEKYLSLLLDLGIAKGEGEAFVLSNPQIRSFGPTLEWFIAEMFRRELASPAYYGVKLHTAPPGGDYDVISLWGGNLIYVEVKSSPPRGVEREEIRSFLLRLGALLPDCAFLFNDTHLRMKDKIIPFLEEEISHLSAPVTFTRLTGELFHLEHRLYVINSKKRILENFLLCLRDFLLHTVLRTPSFLPMGGKDLKTSQPPSGSSRS